VTWMQSRAFSTQQSAFSIQDSAKPYHRKERKERKGRKGKRKFKIEKLCLPRSAGNV
jgi:hypothetical protein